MPTVVSALLDLSPAEQALEVVERKGLGHPDTICDALAEELCLALSRFYLERFGFVLHHNVDKVLLRGGSSRPAFGGGEVTEPIEIYLAGRATSEYRGVRVPIQDLAVACCEAWLRRHLHALDVSRHVRVHCLVRPGSSELVELFEHGRTAPSRLANDTSFGIGFAPFSPLERAVLEVERALRREPAAARGEDVKVMGVRTGARAELTLACAMIGEPLRDLDAYLETREHTRALAEGAARTAFGGEAALAINTADAPERGEIYLTVTGTSAEAGDDGQTGRGNRASGLITPARPMTLESIAGKNPISHVGKIYNYAATEIAELLVRELEELREARVLLVSQIGRPIREPQAVHLMLRSAPGISFPALAERARSITATYLEGIDELWRRLIERNLATGEPAA
jgi:S-adenosylmethionine synthetase